MSTDTNDSYCGIYCGACDIMMSYKTGRRTRLASLWNVPTVKKFQKKMGLDYDENRACSLECHGCKSGTLFVNCRACGIRICARKKMLSTVSTAGTIPADSSQGLIKWTGYSPT